MTSGIDRHGKVGSEKSRCIVDAVADHGDTSSLFFKPFDICGFFMGKFFAQNMVDSDCFSDSPGRRFAVTRDHGCKITAIVQCARNMRGAFSNGIPKGKDTAEPLVIAHKNGGIPMVQLFRKEEIVKIFSTRKKGS